MKIRFTRDTDPAREGKTFKAGEVVEVAPASARHWFARDAAVEVKPGSPRPLTPDDRAHVVDEMEKQITEIANAQPAPLADAESDGSRAGDGSKSDSAPGKSGSSPKGGGRSGK